LDSDQTVAAIIAKQKCWMWSPLQPIWSADELNGVGP
jgi:hypothetical protein